MLTFSIRLIFVSVLIILVVAYSFFGCESGNRKVVEKQYSAHAMKGKQLADKYCNLCHLKPDPSLLDKNTWANVLPIMQREMARRYVKIFYMDWISIEEYYNEASPMSLPDIDREVVSKSEGPFMDHLKVDMPHQLDANITLLEYVDSVNALLIGDDKGNVVVSDGKRTKFSVTLPSCLPINATYSVAKNKVLLLNLGTMEPSQELNGSLIEVDANGKTRILVDSLSRPVWFEFGDFNEDGSDDFLISSFGAPGEKYTGDLSLYVKSDDRYVKHTVKDMPGAVRTFLGDFNADGLVDVVALFAQGKETIILFTNKGDLTFDEKVLAEFPPVYGTSDFLMEDFNDDGSLDIICVNGDNGDYSAISKYYHGVRLLVNNGSNEFTEKYFFPINGASKIVVDDFNKDGDTDFCVMARYPDLKKRPQESILYFDNEGDLEFEPSSIEETPSGNWLLLEKGDLDHDGFAELILGANMMKSIPQPAAIQDNWKKSKTSVVVFKNLGK